MNILKKINKKRALEILMRVLNIPGISCQESLIANEVKAILAESGVDKKLMVHDAAHRKSPAGGAVGNLVVKLPGDNSKPRLMLSAHMDTVPICEGCEPKKSGQKIVSANKQTGLGGDDRAGVAAALVAVIETLESGASYPPITLCFFVQEEIGLHGSKFMNVAKLGKPSMALNFDGGDPYKLTIGATGGERMKIYLSGVPAHAGIAPQAGASAIEAAGLAIASLKTKGWLGAVKKGRKLGTSNIGVIKGGAATNVVTDHVELAAEARSHDSQFRDEIATRIQDAFIEAAAKVANVDGVAVQADVQRRVDYESFRLSDQSDEVQRVARAIEQTGQQATFAVSNGGVDANWLNAHGIPAVTLGCGQREIHTKDEWLDLPDYYAACQIARGVIENEG